MMEYILYACLLVIGLVATVLAVMLMWLLLIDTWTGIRERLELRKRRPPYVDKP